MATPPNSAPKGLPLFLAVFLLCPSFLSPRSFAECLGEAPRGRALFSHVAGISVMIPESWKPEVTELTRGIWVEDKERGCVLEVVRSPRLLTLSEVVVLYERLYFGLNRLDAECGKQVAAALTWPEQLLLGQYSQRDFGRFVQVFYAMFDGEIVVGQLKCPRRGRAESDWSVAAAIFASFRKIVPPDQV